jgi:hypothetical protein
MKQKNIFLLSLLVLVLLGLAFAAWQSGSGTPDSGWQKPVIQVGASTPTLTAAPGWWETPVERPVVPTMPGKKANLTPTPEKPAP